MIRNNVAIVKAASYELDCVRTAVEESIKLIGGLESVIAPDARVFVKINHLSPPSPPERGIITHPAFLKAVLTVLKQITTNIVVGDDIRSRGEEDGFSVSGVRQVCEQTDVRLTNVREDGFVEVDCDGRILNNILISKAALEADVIVNLPKLKTHSLTLMTGGVKNMYGLIPAGLRSRFHGEHIQPDRFNNLLVDIFAALPPQLTLMDGIAAMEGEGPANGLVRKLGVVLASRDTVSVDAVAARIIGIEPREVATTRLAERRGLGIGNLDDIQIVGEALDDVSVNDFARPASSAVALMEHLPRFLASFFVSQLAVRLTIDADSCTGCRECTEICPVGAVTMYRSVAQIDQHTCIRCMCCHEVCRDGAVVPRRSFLGRSIHRLVTLGRHRTSQKREETQQ